MSHMSRSAWYRRRASVRIAVMLPLVSAIGCASGGKGKASNDDVHTVRALPPDAGPTPDADAMPSGFRSAFVAADMRARAIVYYQQCSATVLRLRAGGAFGALAQAPRAVYCERTSDGIPIGGVYDVDSMFTRARRLTMVRLDGTRPKYLEAIDTTRITRSAKLVRDVTRDVSSGLRKQGRAFAVVPFFASDGGTEAWVIPVASAARSVVLGGEVSYIRADDGSLSRVTDHGSTWKVIPLPANGVVTLVSAERDVAGVGDLTVARSLTERGRMVVVKTQTATSSLVPGSDPSGSRFTWEHARSTK